MQEFKYSPKQILLKYQGLLLPEQEGSHQLSLHCKCRLCSKPEEDSAPQASQPEIKRQSNALYRFLMSLNEKQKADLVDIPILDSIIFSRGKGEDLVLFATYDEKEGTRLQLKRSGQANHLRLRKFMINRLMEKQLRLRKRQCKLGDDAMEQNLDEKGLEVLKRAKQKVEESRTSGRQFFLLKDDEDRKHFINQYQFLDLFRLKANNKNKLSQLIFIQSAPVSLTTLNKVERLWYSAAEKSTPPPLLLKAQELVVSQLNQRQIHPSSHQLSQEELDQPLTLPRFKVYQAVTSIQIFTQEQVEQLVTQWVKDELDCWYLSDVLVFNTRTQNGQRLKRDKVYNPAKIQALVTDLGQRKKMLKKSAAGLSRTYERLSQKFQSISKPLYKKYNELYQQAEVKIINPHDREVSDYKFRQINPTSQYNLSQILRNKTSQALLQLKNNFVKPSSHTDVKPRQREVLAKPRRPRERERTIVAAAESRRKIAAPARERRKKVTENSLSLKTLLTIL